MKVKVLLAVLLVLGSTGWITSTRLALGQRLQAEALVANLGKANSSADIKSLRTAQKQLRQAVNILESIPNVPGSGYQQTQTKLAELRPRLDAVERRLKTEEQASVNLQAAQKLAMEAATIVQNPPHVWQVWQKAQSKWQEAITLLEAIPEETFVSASAKNKLLDYRSNYTLITKRLLATLKPQDWQYAQLLYTLNHEVSYEDVRDMHPWSESYLRAHPVLRKEYQYKARSRSEVTALTFSPDGRLLVSGNNHPKNNIKIWNVRNSKLLHNLHDDGYTLHEPGASVENLAFDLDGKTLISTNESYPEFWNAYTGQESGTFSTEAKEVFPRLVSSSGRIVLSATLSYDLPIKILGLNTGKLIRTLPNGKPQVFCANQQLLITKHRESIALHQLNKSADNLSRTKVLDTFSELFDIPDTLSGSDYFFPIVIWDLSTGKLIRLIKEGEGKPRAISPDGQILVSESVDGIKILNLRSGQLLRTLYGEKIVKPPFLGYDLSRGIAFSPDGQIFATATENEIKIWNLNTGELLKTLTPEHSPQVITFSPDRQTIASGGSDGTIKVWRISSQP